MNFCRSFLAKVFLVGLSCSLTCGPVRAVTVFFGDEDRGPDANLQIQGVFVSGTHQLGGMAGQPVTISGVGLGSAALGQFGTIDRRQTYSAGNGESYTSVREALSLSVDGKINSISITPYFSIMGSGESLWLPFDISYYPHGTVANSQLFYLQSVGNLMTFSFEGDFCPSSIELGLVADYGNVPNFYSYLEGHGFPEITFQFGYSVQSIDYTPVPEPGTLSFLGLSVFSALCFKRKKDRRQMP